MNLIVDIGNSLIKCYVFDNEVIVDRVVVENFSDIRVENLIDTYLCERAIVASTRGVVELPIFFEKIIKTVVFTSNTAIPIANSYLSKTIGVDRLAAAVQACAIANGGDAMIVDFGTAITVDFVKDGAFLGGFISAGLSMRLKAMNAFTASLPLCDVDYEMDYDVNYVPNTTKDALIHGAINSVLFEIERYMSDNSDKMIIFTGGDANYFVKLIKMPIFADYELVPKGLNRILVNDDED